MRPIFEDITEIFSLAVQCMEHQLPTLCKLLLAHALAIDDVVLPFESPANTATAKIGKNNTQGEDDGRKNGNTDNNR